MELSQADCIEFVFHSTAAALMCAILTSPLHLCKPLHDVLPSAALHTHQAGEAPYGGTEGRLKRFIE